MESIVYYLLSALAVLIALTIHEYCHGYAAYRLGDDTAKLAGRLTLNPINHIDPIGALCMLFFHIGWAKPVPVNPSNFKDAKKGFALTALAGPLSNLILGFFSAFVYLLLYALLKDVHFETRGFLFNLASNALLFIMLFHSINIGLGLFNLLPIPPFDGSRLLNVVLPSKIYFKVMRYEREIYYGVLAWLLFGNYVTRLLRMIPLVANISFLNWFVGIFSLSNMLSTVIRAVSNLTFDFWQLIPFLKF